VFVEEEQKYEEGRRFVGGRPTSPFPGAQNVPSLKRGPVNVWTEAAGHGAVIAIDPQTGEKKWKFPMTDVTDSGILTTATDVLFTGSREGYFHALDARSGTLLWKTNLGGQIDSGPMTFEVEGEQYVTVAAGHSLFTFALRDRQ
jgi:alcohol dehydrogenase (cytochrome c)